MTSLMTSYDVRNEKFAFLACNNPKYKINSLENITKGGIVVVSKSITSNCIDILRKMSKNDKK